MNRRLMEGSEAIALSAIEADTGVRAERVRLMGGGARSALWVQLVADIFERPVEVTEHSETTALGAAVLAVIVVAVAGSLAMRWVQNVHFSITPFCRTVTSANLEVHVYTPPRTVRDFVQEHRKLLEERSRQTSS